MWKNFKNDPPTRACQALVAFQYYCKGKFYYIVGKFDAELIFYSPGELGNVNPYITHWMEFLDPTTIPEE